MTETVNTLTLRQLLGPLGNPFFDTKDDTFESISARYQEWNNNPNLTFEERQSGAQIFNEVVQGL